jgi:hypothetical protein
MVLLDYAAAALLDGGGGSASSSGFAGEASSNNVGVLMEKCLRHISASGVVAMDCEQAEEQPASGLVPPLAAAAARAQGTQKQPCNGGSGKRQLAMLQLLVPRVAYAHGTSSSSSMGGGEWPARIYLIALPRQQEAAAAVINLLKPVLTSSRVVKVMHDARQVGECGDGRM